MTILFEGNLALKHDEAEPEKVAPLTDNEKLRILKTRQMEGQWTEDDQKELLALERKIAEESGELLPLSEEELAEYNALSKNQDGERSPEQAAKFYELQRRMDAQNKKN